MGRKRKVEMFDINSLIKISTYAKKKGMSKQNVHYHIEKKHLETKEIDGEVFIVI